MSGDTSSNPFIDAIIGLCEPNEICFDILETFSIGWRPAPYNGGVDQYPIVLSEDWLAITTNGLRTGKFLSNPTAMSFSERKKWDWLKPDFYRKPQTKSPVVIECGLIPFGSISQVTYREVRTQEWIDPERNFWHWSGVWEQLGFEKNIRSFNAKIMRSIGFRI